MDNQKIFFSYDEQIQKLKDKGLIISDEIVAVQLLKRYSYYALISGYKYPFKSKDNQYKIKTTIEDIYTMYKFDEDLRHLFLKNILEVENHIKSLISYAFCSQYGESQSYYLSKDCYNNINDNHDGIDKLIVTFQGYIDSPGSYRYMSYHQKKYHNIPLWVMMKALTLGSVSRMYSLLDFSIQGTISKEFDGINESSLGKMLDLLARIRNVSAHNERLFNYRYKRRTINDTFIHSELNIPKKNGQYSKGKNDLLAVIIAFQFLQDREDFLHLIKTLDDMINKLCNEVKNLDKLQIYKYMGLPNNWLQVADISRNR
ncbi:MAG: Abi family protein [Eubacteriales bacterium]